MAVKSNISLTLAWHVRFHIGRKRPILEWKGEARSHLLGEVVKLMWRNNWWELSRAGHVLLPAGVVELHGPLGRTASSHSVHVLLTNDRLLTVFVGMGRGNLVVDRTLGTNLLSSPSPFLSSDTSFVLLFNSGWKPIGIRWHSVSNHLPLTVICENSYSKGPFLIGNLLKWYEFRSLLFSCYIS